MSLNINSLRDVAMGYHEAIKPSFHMCKRYAERIINIPEEKSEEYTKEKYKDIFVLVMNDYFKSRLIYSGSLTKGNTETHRYYLYKSIIFIVTQNHIGRTIYTIPKEATDYTAESITKKFNSTYSDILKMYNEKEHGEVSTRRLEFLINELKLKKIKEKSLINQIYLEKLISKYEKEFQKRVLHQKSISDKIMALKKELRNFAYDLICNRWRVNIK